MKHLLLGTGVAMALSSAAGVARAAESPLMAPIHQFVDAFNKGDDKTAAKAFAPGDVSIVDEVPPHLWTGSGALQHWSKDLAAASKAGGYTDEAVTLGEATRADVNGTRGYVVVPAVFAFKEKGAAMREPAQMVYTLKQVSGRWLITGWTWVGGKEEPAQ
jgi:hypothetical protein